MFPYLTGKRVCVGRQIAMIELMLLLVGILQKFQFEEADDYSDMTEVSASGVLRSPQSFHFKVVKL